MQYIEMFVEAVMDSLEEFFDALIVPTARYIRNAFIISLIFLTGTFLCDCFNVWTFVSWQESLTCSIILLIVTLIDSATRHSVKDMAGKIKSIANKNLNRITYTGEDSEEDTYVENEELTQNEEASWDGE